MDYTKINNIVIIYHNNCIDGIAACWATINYFNLLDNNDEYNIKHIGLSPQCLDLFEYLEKYNVDLEKEQYQIIFVDICPSIDILRKLILTNKNESNIIILDHHESNKNIFKDNLTELQGKNIHWVFDMTRSGCQIAWDTFHISKHLGIPEPYPWFIKYIGDGDIWKFTEPNAKIIYNILGDNFKTISSIDFLNKNTFEFFKDKYLKEAEIIQRYKIKKIKSYIAKALKIIFKCKNIEYKCWFILCTDIELISELGNQLTNTKFDSSNNEYPDFVIIIKNIDINNIANISLRSNKKNKDINVATISGYFNGGGHPQASGFTMNYNDLISNIKLIKI